MSTAYRDLTPEERIGRLELELLKALERICELEFYLESLRQDVNAKAGEYHDHSDLERQIRDTEYHTHREYADSRHNHDRYTTWMDGVGP